MNPNYRDKDSECTLEIRQYNRDVQLFFRGLYIAHLNTGIPNKRMIQSFSEQSARRLRHYLRNSMDLWKAMITLTYPAEYPCNGKTVKAQVDNFCHWLRRRQIKYFWILEFQRRGAPHFHFLTSAQIDKDIVSRKWYEVVASGDLRHLSAGTRCDVVRNESHLMGYMVGYLKKLGYQKHPPKGFEQVGRWWGCSRDILAYTCRVFSGAYAPMSAEFRGFRKWYAHHLKQFGIKWRWKGAGFTALDGNNALLALYASNGIFRNVRKVAYKLQGGQISKIILEGGEHGKGE